MTDRFQGGVRLLVFALLALTALRATAEGAPPASYESRISEIESMFDGIKGPDVSATEMRSVQALPTLPAPDPAEAHTVSVKKKKADEVTYLVDKAGTPLFTNAPTEYLRMGAYTEVTIRWNPISVPSRFKKTNRKGSISDSEIRQTVQHYARRYGLQESLIYAVIRAESNFNPYAVSPAGARGLMQLMPSTAVQMDVTDIFDPAQNVAGGSQYLSEMLRMFGNNLDLALAAYNAGPGAVQKYGGIPPYKETRQYVTRVKRFMKEYGGGNVHVHVASAPAPVDEPVGASNVYRVRFTRSKLTQLADEVTEKNGYYFIRYGSRVDQVPKSYVASIDEPA